MDITILVVEDEPAIAEIIKLYLEREGFTVYTAVDGDQLPKLSGWKICQSIQRPAAIIFLSATCTELDMLTAFSLGAADYITKPFSPRELVARVKAVLRRTCLLSQPTIYSVSFPQ